MDLQVRINPGHQTLSGCFFVTRCAVYLPCKEEITDELGFQTMVKLGWGEEIVFYGITGTV